MENLSCIMIVLWVIPKLLYHEINIINNRNNTVFYSQSKVSEVDKKFINLIKQIKQKMLNEKEFERIKNAKFERAKIQEEINRKKRDEDFAIWAANKYRECNGNIRMLSQYDL